MRRTLLALLLLLPAPLAGAAEPNPLVATLTAGTHVFWDESVATASGTSNVTRRFRLDVVDGGRALRIGVNGKPRGSDVRLTVRDPSNALRHDASFAWNSGEVFFDNAPAGTWSLTVRSPAQDVYRMRARLEGDPDPQPQPPVTLLPNLRLIPPYDFTFNGALRINGSSPNGSCNPDDVAHHGARRCLRFSLGPANGGPGPFHVRFTPLQGVATDGQAYQIVYDSDGNTSERPAGVFRYHASHAHYHHSGFGSLELLRVDPETRTMTPAGAGPKQGFCTADIVMYDFDRFIQPREHVPSECLDGLGFGLAYGPTGTQMAISPGWADIYIASQDGNYVELGDNGDGYYVVRSTTDAEGWILETDESDNTSYAYLSLEGTNIRVLERGFGQGPFDPERIVATDRYPTNS